MRRRVRLVVVAGSVVLTAFGCGTLVPAAGTGSDHDSTTAPDDAASDHASADDAADSADGGTTGNGAGEGLTTCPRRCTGSAPKNDNFDTLDDWPHMGPATLDTVDFLSPPSSMAIDARATSSTSVTQTGFASGVLCLELCLKLRQSGTFGDGDVELLSVTTPSSDGGPLAILSLHAGATDRIVAASASTTTTLPRGDWFHLRTNVDTAASTASFYLNDAPILTSAPVPTPTLAINVAIGAIPTGTLPATFLVHVDDIALSQE